MVKHRSKSIVALSLAAALVWTTPAAFLPQRAAAAEIATFADSVLSPQAQEYADYLQEKYGIAVAASWTRGQFADALNAVVSPGTEKAIVLTGNTSEPLTAIEAVSLALKAADLEELAYTYSANKAKVSLAWVKLGWTSEEYAADKAKILAAAVNTGLLVSSYYPEIRNDAVAPSSLAAVLLGKVLEAKGLYKRYLGTTTDADILVKLGDAYRTSDIIQAPELRQIVDKALKQNLVTGYNLKDSRFDANFLDSLSVVYGHSDFKHALQLVGLLRSEKIKAKVQFEPKTSAFIYLKEWGDPGQSDLFEVVQIETKGHLWHFRYPIEGRAFDPDDETS